MLTIAQAISPPLDLHRTSLGQYLLEKKLISPVQLHAALAEQQVTQERLGFILARDGFISRKTLLDAIIATNADQIHSEYVFSNIVPGELLLSTQTMVVAETDSVIYLATLGSEKQALVEFAPYYPGIPLVFVSANFEQMDNYLEDVRAMLQDDDSLVDKLLRKAFSDGVSDIHIVPRYNSYSVLCRHLGVRQLTHEGDLDEYNTLAARIKDLSRMDLAERRIPQDGSFQMEFNGKLVDLRVSSVPTTNSEYITIRLLDPDRVQPSLTGLGISRVDDWRKGLSRPEGINLICGPTGSGKTTTLSASIRELDRFGSSIFTLEDPVELRLPYIGQVNVNPAVGLDFARGIRAFMRTDPDVIIVGEIRDVETARNAIKAGETGHLVMGTLHTRSIHGAAQRLRDLDVPANELVYLLRSVLVQRLIRVICPKCKGARCPFCRDSGYSSRTIISECAYFPTDVEVSRMLAGERWWPSLLEDAIALCETGATDRKEVIRVFGEDAIVYFNNVDNFGHASALAKLPTIEKVN
ncbi:MAG: ATPase, T2SS/T4P/T4SS family [Agitococcus sp.]|nr:ATPase, T2SS/T4P/T4SS family [Agitococcus sp.]MDO9176972.1 ATPase, T2SS/T4P/T4SS family [Agitococcus sp.]